MQWIALIIVVVGIVFLAVFNLAAAKKGTKRSERPMPESDAIIEDEQAVADEVAAHAEPVAAETISAGPDGLQAKSKDAAYRSALRGFADKEPSSEREAEVPPPSRDRQYRDALRAFDKKTE